MQKIIVIVLVVAAVVFLLKRLRGSSSGKRHGGCGHCGCSHGENKNTQE